MRKLIAITSTCLSLTLAVILANADDATESSMQSQQEAGTTSEAVPHTEATPQVQSSETQETVKKYKRSASKKSCTNEDGTTFRKGQAGFKECMSSLKKKSPDQMGGEVSDSMDMDMNSDSSS